MSSPKVEIKNLKKIYYKNLSSAIHYRTSQQAKLMKDDIVALNQISVHFNSGDIIGIIGSNGAGKSTLLSILAGITKETDGQIKLSGKVTAVLTLGVGLREDLTGRENIFLDSDIQGKSREEMNETVDEIISFSELEDFIDRPVKTYSTGMKSRLAFSMLVCINPDILIIDEALSAGDIFFAEKANKKIKEICRKGKLVIIVSHSMEAIEDICNRCIWLENGQILRDGEPSNVIKEYLESVQHKEMQQHLSSISTQEIFTLPEADHTILNFEMKSMEKSNLSERAFFYTNESILIDFELSNTSAKEEATLQFIIERFDGVIVTHETYELKDENSNQSDQCIIRMNLFLECLILNTGFYVIKLEMIDKQKVTALLHRQFEVKNRLVHEGAEPLLHYLGDVTLSYEEDRVCSDLI